MERKWNKGDARNNQRQVATEGEVGASDKGLVTDSGG